ncbi:MAG TPA: TraB/GumN family protein [Candidatus Kapabacteria bacterium]|nr:TraB/GumN family protein [Candidatus Kapabacteria bacterium]
MRVIFYLVLIIFNLSFVWSKNFMWEVKSDKSTCYILGSVHLADSSIYPMDQAISDAFDKSQVLVLEIDISNINPTDVLKYTMLADTNTLAGAVDKITYKKFEDLFKKHNVPFMAYSKLKPWFAVMTLQSLEMISSNYSIAYGIDLFFLDKAQNKNMKIKELESFAFQMKVLDTLNNFSGKFLDYTLEEINDTGKQVADILKAWKNGDSDKMSEIVNQGFDIEGFDEVMHIINNQRNYNMLDKIEQYLQSNETHFVVVGAAHLVGKEGLIQLLKSKNKYTINQK